MKKQLSIVLLVLLLAGPAWAQQFCPLNPKMKPKAVANYEVFKRIPVLEDGRVKPLDTFARNLVLRFSGKSSVNREPAIQWLARLLFAPEMTVKDKIFLVNNPEILVAIGAEPDQHRRYSFSELQPGYEKLHELAIKADAMDKKSRTVVEDEILRLDSNLSLYIDLSYTFKFAFTQPDLQVTDAQVKKELGLPEDQNEFSFIDLALRANQMSSISDVLTKKDSDEWTPQQREIVRILSVLYQWSNTYQNLPLHMIPSAQKGDENWYSPWDALSNGFRNEPIRKELVALRDVALAYWNGKQLEFDLAARTFSDSALARGAEKGERGTHYIELETLYNSLDLFLWAKIFYFLAFILFLVSLPMTSKQLYGIAWLLVVLGALLHTLSLAMRIIMLGRPPVSNLYETFIFVGFVACMVGLIIESINKNWLGLVVSSVCGFIFLTIAAKFSAEGDTLRMLIAVLNSNFWLGTHVTSITTGYAGVCVAGILGHVYILQGIFKKNDHQLLNTTYNNIVGVLGFGLTMTFLGTNLGGIWADQSWGRFWGWDPKENGALLIVLWCAILFHARIGRMIGPLGMAVGSVLGIVVVMWAWFGVNLLSVGLHSYGFTSGVAVNLIIYLVVETLFLLLTVPRLRKKIS